MMLLSSAKLAANSGKSSRQREFPTGMYLFKVSKGNTSTMCEIKTPEQHQSGTNFTHCSGVSIVDFEHANDG